jgi:hypothetical protein
MKTITKAAWGRVVEKACDIGNASMDDNDVLVEVQKGAMLELPEELEMEFGSHSCILDTKADFLENPEERRLLYLRALALAREAGDADEVEMILESLQLLDDERGA